MATDKQTAVNLDEELRARVPGWMKAAVRAIGQKRILEDADIVREAVREYVERHQPAAEAAAPEAAREVEA